MTHTMPEVGACVRLTRTHKQTGTTAIVEGVVDLVREDMISLGCETEIWELDHYDSEWWTVTIDVLAPPLPPTPGPGKPDDLDELRRRMDEATPGAVVELRADARYRELRRLLDFAPNSGSWTWMELASRGIDPSKIPAFLALNHREHPGAGEPMTAVEHPADGTTPELSGERGGATTCCSGHIPHGPRPGWCSNAEFDGCEPCCDHCPDDDRTKPACNAVYPPGPNPMPNTRIVHCGRPSGHDGDHEEFIDGEPSGCPWPNGATA